MFEKGNKLAPKPFVAGNCANPKGRPKLPNLREALAKVLNDERGGTSAVEAIIKSQFNRAIKGDTKAAEWLIDRGYGKVVQNINVMNGVKKLAERMGEIIIEFVPQERIYDCQQKLEYLKTEIDTIDNNG